MVDSLLDLYKTLAGMASPDQRHGFGYSTIWCTWPSVPLTTIHAEPEAPFAAPTAPVKLSLPNSVRCVHPAQLDDEV